MIDIILKIGLEIYKNQNSVKKVFKPKYLNYNLTKLISFYQDENILNRKIPYVEIINFINNKDIKVKLIKINEKFHIDSNNSTMLKTFQTNALKEFKNKGKFTFDSNTVRLNSFNITENEIQLEIQKSKYSDQVQSHLVLDWQDKSLKEIGITNYRGLLISKYGNKLPPLSSKLLSNSIGISIILYYKKNNEWQPYLPFRNKSIFNKNKNEPALYEGIYHCSSSGVLDWSEESINEDYLKNEMFREINEEIGLEQKDIQKIKLLAITREILRAGKPQFFYVGFTNLSENELIQKRINAIEISTNNKEKVEIQNKHLLQSKINLKLKKSIISLEAIGNLYYSEKYIKTVHNKV